METASPVKRVPRSRKPAGAFHHGNLRDAAIALAVRDVEAHGHGQLSLNALAPRLGVTGPALYRHFADRRALLHAVAQVGFERFEAEITSAFDGASDRWQGMLDVGLAYVRFSCAHPHWFRLQFLSEPEVRPVPDMAQTPPRYRDRLVEVLNHEFRDAERVRHAYMSLWGLVHGLAVLCLEGNLPAPGSGGARDIVEATLRIHLDGLRALASPPRRTR